MIAFFYVCYLDDKQAIRVREKFFYEDEALEFMKLKPGHFLIKAEEL